MDNTPARRFKPRSLKIAFFNANGLRHKREEVAQFLREHGIDVMLVQETLLKPSYRDPKIANYRTVRHDRLTDRGGGTVIYYRNSLHCSPLDSPALTNLEVSACRLGMTGHPDINIISAYLSPNKTILQTDLNAVFAGEDSVILAGDLNCRHVQWHCNPSNSNGRALLRMTDTLDIDIVAPMEATHYPPIVEQRPSTLDIALFKSISLGIRSVEVIHQLSSDHRPVTLELGPPPNTAPPTRLITDWEKVASMLADHESPLYTALNDHVNSLEDTAAAVDCLTSGLRAIVSACTREVPVAVDRRWQLPSYLRDLIRQKNAATRAYDSCPSPSRKNVMNRLQTCLKRQVQAYRNEMWNDLLGEISPSHQAYWKLVRALKTDTVVEMPPLTRPDHPTPAFDDIDKAECLASSLEAQCSPSAEPVDPAHLALVNDEVERRALGAPEGPPLRPVTLDEVKSLVRKLKPKKAPGADGISNRLIKSFPENLLIILVAIFNTCLSKCQFPAAWKQADVIGIHKPGKPRPDPTSYRPISLLNSLGKLYERVILSRLRDVIDDRDLLMDEQFGFRAGHSCVQQVHRLSEHVLFWMTGWGKSIPTGAVFLDVAKAFDKVWHNGLLYKLYSIGVPDRLVRILRDYLVDRSFRYRVEGTHSAPHPIRAGVPQGSVLSPTLFSLYINDIPKIPGVHYALFADDTAIYTSSPRLTRITQLLQSAINALGHWCRNWRIEVNPEKSAAVFFSRSTRYSALLRNADHITLYDKRIPWRDDAKYLGVTLDKRLNFFKHIKTVRDRAAFFTGRLHCLLNSRSKLSLHNKLSLYKTCIRPVFSYASAVFAHASPYRLKPLQVLQNRILRRAVGAPWYVRNTNLHTDLRIPSVAEHFRTLSKSHFERAANSKNRLIRETVDYVADLPPRKGIRRPRHVLTDPDDPITVRRKEEAELDIQLLARLAAERASNPSVRYRPNLRRPRGTPHYELARQSDNDLRFGTRFNPFSRLSASQRARHDQDRAALAAARSPTH